MNYINTTTLAQLSESEIRALNPNTSYPSPFLEPGGYAFIFPAPQPAHDPITQRVQAIAPELTVLGHWEQRWNVVELFETQEEKDAALALDRASKVAVKSDAIKAERDRRKFNGVKVGTQWIHTDTYSRTQWMAMVMMGASIPAIDWTTMDGTSVVTSQALAGQVFQGTAQLDAQLFGYAKMLITQVEAAADPASVDITVGWPATFEPA